MPALVLPQALVVLLAQVANSFLFVPVDLVRCVVLSPVMVEPVPPLLAEQVRFPALALVPRSGELVCYPSLDMIRPLAPCISSGDVGDCQQALPPPPPLGFQC